MERYAKKYILFVNGHVMDCIPANTPQEALFSSNFAPTKPIKRTSRGEAKYMLKEVETKYWSYFTLK